MGFVYFSSNFWDRISWKSPKTPQRVGVVGQYVKGLGLSFTSFPKYTNYVIYFFICCFGFPSKLDMKFYTIVIIIVFKIDRYLPIFVPFFVFFFFKSSCSQKIIKILFRLLFVDRYVQSSDHIAPSGTFETRLPKEEKTPRKVPMCLQVFKVSLLDQSYIIISPQEKQITDDFCSFLDSFFFQIFSETYST